MTRPGAACRYANQERTRYTVHVRRSRRNRAVGRATETSAGEEDGPVVRFTVFNDTQLRYVGHMTSSPGPRRVTLAQVADLAGVSVMTASYTYNRPERVSDGSRARVLAAAAQLGYAGPDPSARSLRRGSTLTLGVVLGEHLHYAFDDPGAVSFLAGVAEVCAATGYGMTILPISGVAEEVARVTGAAVDGFIVWTTSDDDPVVAAVRATG